MNERVNWKKQAELLERELAVAKAQLDATKEQNDLLLKEIPRVTLACGLSKGEPAPFSGVLLSSDAAVDLVDAAAEYDGDVQTLARTLAEEHGFQVVPK